MFPVLYGFYEKAIAIYTFEQAEGAGRATDLVIQPFVRFISMAFFPVVICASVLYLLVSDPRDHLKVPIVNILLCTRFQLVEVNRWDPAEFFQFALLNIALNQTWTSLFVWIILAFPEMSIRIFAVISAFDGFTNGSLLSINKIPQW